MIYRVSTSRHPLTLAHRQYDRLSCSSRWRCRPFNVSSCFTMDRISSLIDSIREFANFFNMILSLKQRASSTQGKSLHAVKTALS